MTVSLCVIAYNEERVLDHLFEDILAQSLLKEKQSWYLLTVVPPTVQGINSWILKENMVRNTFRLRCWIIQKNTGGRMEYCAYGGRRRYNNRLDAHASIPRDFIENNERLIGEGESMSAAAQDQIISKSLHPTGNAPCGGRIYVRQLYSRFQTAWYGRQKEICQLSLSWRIPKRGICKKQEDSILLWAGLRIMSCITV